MGLFKRFFQDRIGSVGVMAAISIVPLLGMVGVGVDYGRAIRAEVKLQAALDSAALAAASAFQEISGVSPRRVARANFRASMGDMRGQRFRLRGRDGRYTASAQVTVDNFLLPLIGVDEFVVQGSATAARIGGGAAEVVLALDTTNSMGFGTSWQDARAAIMSALRAMKQGSNSEGFFASFVPFTDRVNIGPRAADWYTEAPDTAKGFQGCVEPRQEPIPGLLSDDAPTSAPFAPTQQGDYGPRRTCNPQDIVGPTRQLGAISRAISNLSKGGTGRFDIGMAWSWRLVSSEWRGQWGIANYPSRQTNGSSKVIAMFTDGHTEAYTEEFGHPQDWGWNNASRLGLEALVDLCEQIKASGVRIHMMHVNGNVHAGPYFQRCASDISAYHQIGDERSLRDALVALAKENFTVRLVD